MTKKEILQKLYESLMASTEEEDFENKYDALYFAIEDLECELDKELYFTEIKKKGGNKQWN